MLQFLSVKDVSSVAALTEKVLQQKAAPMAHNRLGQGKTLGLLFLNPSLRTRMSTQIAARNLGMDVIVLNQNQDSWQLEFRDEVIMNGNTVEHVKDAAQVISTYCDIVGLRCFPGLQDYETDYAEYFLHQFQKYCSRPLISLESATRHPLQSLADLATIRETWSQPRPPRVVLCWAPHIKPLPQAVANSFAEWILAAGWPLDILQPEGYELDPSFTAGAQISYDREALKTADYIYFKNWSSVKAYGEMPEPQSCWVTPVTPEICHPSAHFMHCLPVRRNLEVMDSILDHPNSLIYRQAANRVYSAQAVLHQILTHE